MPTLIYEKTGQPVNVGDVIHSNGRAVIVCGWTEPRHPASTGQNPGPNNGRPQRLG
jgi:hypothetical protein